MAVTKTHPIKSTLKAAIDYIGNPEKADGKLLVSSYDERRSDKGFLLQDDPTRGSYRAAVLHLPIRLREKRRTGLLMVMDTLRAAVRHLAAPPLDHTGRRLPGWWDCPVCPVCIELYYRRCDWRFRPGLAANRGGVVCAADGVPAARWLIFLRHGNMENSRSCRWKSHSQPSGKRQVFFHRSANSFPQPRNPGSLRTFPQCLLRRLFILAFLYSVVIS